MSASCLFTAAASFMLEVQAEYQHVLPTVFQEVWQRAQLPPQSSATVWVVNPGQGFMVDAEALERFPRLEAVVTPSTGCRHIDLAACQRLGLPVYGLLDDREGLERIAASAEFTFLLLLNALRRLDVGVKEIEAGRWREREDLLRGRELQGKRVGLVGFGRIGRRLARYCAAFGAQAAYYDPYVRDAPIPARPLEALFQESDIVCVCCVLTPETGGMIDAPLLRQLKRGAVLVNTARGEIVPEGVLAQVLGERPDLTVAYDVLAGEPTGTQADSPLMALRAKGQVTLTPHMAGTTRESNVQAARVALGLIRRHLARRSVPA